MIYVTFLVLVAATVFSTFDVNAQSTLKCEDNQILDPCGRRCEKKCNDLVNDPAPSSCEKNECKGPACRCMSGFVRNPYTDRCVGLDQCFPDGCGPGEVLFSCDKTCETTCKNPAHPRICQIIKCPTGDCRCDLADKIIASNNGTEMCVKIEEC